MKFKNAYDKTSIPRTIRTANLIYGEISVRQNIRTANFLTVKFLYGEISLQQNFLTAKYPTAKYLTAKLPSAACMVPQAHVAPPPPNPVLLHPP